MLCVSYTIRTLYSLQLLSLSVVSKLYINTHNIGKNIIKNIRTFSALIVIIPLKLYTILATNLTELVIIVVTLTL